MKYDKQDLLIILFLAVSIFIFLSTLLLSDFIFYFKDFFRYFYPTRYFTSHCLKEGIIPLWNPYIFCGIPFLAPLQSQLLYPFSFIIYFLPINLGIKLFIVLHIFLAGLFTYFLMQDWGQSKESSLIAGIVYIFSGYFISVYDILNVLGAITWIPFILLFFVKGGRYVIWSGIGITLQFLSGEPTTLFATLLILLLYSLTLLKNRGIPRIILVGFIALGLSSFQLLPFLELVSQSNRASGMSFEEASRWSLAPYELVDLLIPMFSYAMTSAGIFNYIQGLIDSIYLGIIPLSLIFIGICSGRLFWGFIFISFILLSSGEYFPLYKWLYRFIPGFNLMQIPVKFFAIATFAGALLAGFGYEHLIKSKKIKSFLVVSILLFIGLILIQIRFPLVNIFVQTILLALMSLLVLLAKRQSITLNFLSITIVLLILNDLLIAGDDLNPMVKESFYQQKPTVSKLIKGYYRILLSPKTSGFFNYHSGPIDPEILPLAHEAIIPNLCLFHKKVFDANGYECIVLKDYNNLMRIISTGEHGQIHKLLNLLNIKYIISKDKLIGEKLRLIKDGKIKLYENPTCLERIFLVSQVVIIKNRDDILRRMLRKDFDPAKEIILEENIEFKNQKFKIKNPKIIDYQPNKVIIKVSSPCDCFLFISETYYPGWKAFINGQATKIYRANYIFKAVFVPEGTHEVRFVYFPLNFKIGLGITLVSILLLVVYAVTSFQFHQRRCG
ncbi:MAG: YfhO family protein [bacterium]